MLCPNSRVQGVGSPETAVVRALLFFFFAACYSSSVRVHHGTGPCRVRSGIAHGPISCPRFVFRRSDNLTTMDGVTAKQLLGQCDHCAVYPRQQGTLKICSRCRVAKYCSQECQRAAWKQHKKLCHPCNLNAEVSRIRVFCSLFLATKNPVPKTPTQKIEKERERGGSYAFIVHPV